MVRISIKSAINQPSTTLLIQEKKKEPPPGYMVYSTDGVWANFWRSKDKKSSICIECNTELHNNTSTAFCINISRSMHDVTLLKRKTIAQGSSGNSYGNEESIKTHFRKKNGIECVLARMTAKDGMPFSVFSTSSDIRQLFLDAGYTNLPRSATFIRNSVVGYGEQIKSESLKEIRVYRERGVKLSVTLDEMFDNGMIRWI